MTYVLKCGMHLVAYCCKKCDEICYELSHCAAKLTTCAAKLTCLYKNQPNFRMMLYLYVN